MEEMIEKCLIKFVRKTIKVDELEAFFPDGTEYVLFAETILRLERREILEMVQARGRNTKTPSLAHRYRINDYKLRQTFYKLLQTYRYKFHDAIILDFYFSSKPSIWYRDLPYLKKLNMYIENNGFPTKKVPAPERSFELVNDEKWIERGGATVLERVKLWDKLKIVSTSDPLMLAINPERITDDEQFHLIIENKTTYDALLHVLPKSPFATLIYGAGNKISGNIESFSDQYPVKGLHTLFYFGDIDHSGIDIWYRTTRRKTVIPAFPFYLACLQKEAAYGKTNQPKKVRALTKFLTYFSTEVAQAIQSVLSNGAYYPQEILQTDELQMIMLNTDWAKYVK